ncbi:PDDEXK nuclease domain-containing protein [Burkholderia sp. PAMC 26561]|uniref:PDDEXK nuclease domain-containing protein n=1 Tax=Burkholderia sp. PAMC 26561 TaxID=1795043 RepID=UPI00076B277A|nr:PDDEXK nuclease domain-containing protein [Burkholderia sp. PAMC 26561]AME22781.1 hypothetical protein AXG89_01995 [Burkholderia sp. PAMC 26561]
MTDLVSSHSDYVGIHGDIVALLESTRLAAARSVNALMTASYWEIGRRVVEFEQRGQDRAAYGDALIKRLSADLSTRFGRGFSARNLEQMRSFYQAWPTERISQTVSAKLSGHQNPQIPSAVSFSTKTSDSLRRNVVDLFTVANAFPLPWSAYVRLLSVKSEQARTFYEAETLRGGWSVRQLDRQIGSQFYERTALSRNKAAMLEKSEVVKPGDALTPEQAIKDPFVLEFLNLKDEYSESDLEDALIQHLADFLLELGDDFAFVGRQRRLRIDDTWFRVDLLFFHRHLKCLLVIDLKVGKFGYADAGQMHLYLNYAREHWMKPGENPPVGLILCAEKGAAEARYALEGLPNKVLAAEYQTVLPDEKLLAKELAKTRLELEARRFKQAGDVDDDK